MPSSRIAAIVLAATLLSACGQPLPTDREAYAGEWRGAGVTLSIAKDGSVFYEKTSGGSRTQVRGPMKGFDGNDFDVGFWFIVSSFDVSVPPTQKDGVWTMTVDGDVLTRAQ